MKPVKMGEWGTCFPACVASILEMELSEMPTVPVHMNEFSERLRQMYSEAPSTEEIISLLGAWLDETRDRYNKEFSEIWTRWFGQRGLVCTMLDEPPAGYCLALGRHKQFSHCLVLLDGRPVWDPEGYPVDAPEVPWEYERFYDIHPT